MIEKKKNDFFSYHLATNVLRGVRKNGAKKKKTINLDFPRTGRTRRWRQKYCDISFFLLPVNEKCADVIITCDRCCGNRSKFKYECTKTATISSTMRGVSRAWIRVHTVQYFNIVFKTKKNPKNLIRRVKCALGCKEIWGGNRSENLCSYEMVKKKKTNSSVAVFRSLSIGHRERAPGVRTREIRS